MSNLKDLVNSYFELQSKQKELESQLSELKETILNEMDEQKLETILTDEGIKAVRTKKETFKYLNEQKLVEWCEANNHQEYVQKRIITTKFNKNLKDQWSNNKTLLENYSRSESYSLSVK